MVKLMGLDYVIHYKAGKKNRAADSLFRRGIEGATAAVTAAIPSWVTEVTASYKDDEKCKQIIAKLRLQPTPHSQYTYTQGLLRYKERIYMEDQGDIKERISSQLHSSALGGHSGAWHTYKRQTILLLARSQTRCRKLHQELHGLHTK